MSRTMDKRANVLLAFSKCLDRSSGCLNEPECPYVPSCFGPGRHEILPTELVEDIRTLLKAQEPRVMTLEELAAAQKAPVWRETKRAHKDLYNGWMLAYDVQRGQGITGTRQGMTEPNGRVGWCKLDDYGMTWRCWTSRPTDEQREAIPWLT